MISMVVQRLSSIPHCRAFISSGLTKKVYSPQKLSFSLLCNDRCNQIGINRPINRNWMMQSSRLFMGEDAENEENNEKSFEPTWTYTPYKPPPPVKKRQVVRRNYTNGAGNDEWVVPNRITIPEDKIEMSFERSSGAGGQNVNKVS